MGLLNVTVSTCRNWCSNYVPHTDLPLPTTLYLQLCDEGMNHRNIPLFMITRTPFSYMRENSLAIKKKERKTPRLTRWLSRRHLLPSQAWWPTFDLGTHLEGKTRLPQVSFDFHRTLWYVCLFSQTHTNKHVIHIDINQSIWKQCLNKVKKILPIFSTAKAKF